MMTTVIIGTALLVLGLLAAVASGLPALPSCHQARRAMVDSLPADLTGTIIDLGAGWGGLAFDLARRFPNNRVVTIELAPVPWLYVSIRRLWYGQKNLTVRYGNFLHLPLSEAAALVFFLSNTSIPKLKPKFETELAPGTWVVSNHFPVPGWTPQRVVPLQSSFTSGVYVYRTGCARDQS